MTKIFNLQTGEETLVPLTAEEQAEIDAAAALRTPEAIATRKDAEAAAMVASPLIQSLIEEFISATGLSVTPAEVTQGAKARLKTKL